MATCAMGVETHVDRLDVHVLAFVCVMNSVVVPCMLLALLARQERNFFCHRAAPLPKPQARQPCMSALCMPFSSSDSAVPPLTMLAAVSSALGRRFSQSDSALLLHERRLLSTLHERCARTSPSTPTMRLPQPLTQVRTSPVFARMLANTREAPETPRQTTPRRKLRRTD
jgi:hypothetical protein